MKRRFFKRALLVLLGSFLNVAAIAQTDDSGLHLAVFVQGPVGLKRPGWSSYAPVVFGTYLRLGDLVRRDESSQAKVVCSDLTLRDVPAGIVGVPCVAARPLLRRPEASLINPTRGWEGYGSFPLVLSPRKTKVLTPHPVLQWTPVEGIADYRITVRGPDLVWSRAVGSVTKFLYPDGAPDLKPGVDYKLIVEADGRTSDAEAGPGLGFSILPPDEAKAVAREEERIVALGLPAGPTQFLIAHLYAAYGLNAEAIERLEDTSQGFQAPAVARLLGDLYLAVGLTRRAETSYLNSLKLSKDDDDEGRMLADMSLARIYEQALGNTQQAIEHLNAALAVANKLGDKQTAHQAERKSRELKRESRN